MPRRKLTDGQVLEIRRRVQGGESLRRVAPDFGVTWTTIRNVATRGYRGYRNQWGWHEHSEQRDSTVSGASA